MPINYGTNDVRTDGNFVANSGNFSSALTVNNMAVSLNGHTHSSLEITNLTESVQDIVGASGFLVGQGGISLNYNDNTNTLTISGGGSGGTNVSNAGDNRLLTSDGTPTGINAESNFTYDPNTGIVNIYASGLNSHLQLFQNSSDSANQSPRINLRKNRGDANSELPLQSGDFIGSIFWTTLNSSNNNSVAAQIAAYTPSGLSSYTDTPTQLRISNRTKDGSLSHIYVTDDGTLNPTNGLIVNDNAKVVSYEDGRPDALQVYNLASLNDNETCGGATFWSFGVVADSGSSFNQAVGTNTLAGLNVPSGVNLNGSIVGAGIGGYRNAFTDYDDNGTLLFLVGASIGYGHAVFGNNTETTTTQIRGLNLFPLAGNGTIDTVYDIFLGNTIYDQVIDGSGTIKYGTGTITSRYGIYQQSADPNYFAGSISVNNGLSSPTPIYDLGAVSGDTAINYAIDRQIQTLTLNGTSVNFTKGTGWTTADRSVDVVLQITVTSTTTVAFDSVFVTDWYSSLPTFSAGTYLVLLRSIGSTVIQGHYIANKL